MFQIKVTRFDGEALFVDSVRKSYRLGFTVRIQKYAKAFKTREAAEQTIAGFSKDTDLTFLVVPAPAK